MSLNKDVLGLALYTRAQSWNNVDIPDNQLDQARKDFWAAVADEVIKHFKANAVLAVPGTGLIAPSGGGAVTGASVTGTLS
jgi:hypothetical protein